jgi:hypothetical protein
MVAMRTSGIWLSGWIAALGAELLTSYLLKHAGPTDTVLWDYPTTWSYVGEHFLIWSLLALPIFSVGRAIVAKTSRPGGWKDIVMISCTVLATEMMSSLWLWHIHDEVGVPGVWYEDGLGAYLRARLLPWTIGFVAIFACAIVVHRWRRRTTPQRDSFIRG